MTLKEVFSFVEAKDSHNHTLGQRQPVAHTNGVKIIIIKITNGVSKRKTIYKKYALTVVKRDMESARRPRSGRRGVQHMTINVSTLALITTLTICARAKTNQKQ